MSKLKSLFFIVISITFTSAMDQPSLLSQIIEVRKSLESQSNRPTVVFDDQAILCCTGHIGVPLEKNKKEIFVTYPYCPVIPYYDKESGYQPYFFYPHFGEVILSILPWGSICFFSEKPAIRNEKVIPEFLKIILGQYSKDIERDYQELLKLGGA